MHRHIPQPSPTPSPLKGSFRLTFCANKLRVRLIITANDPTCRYYWKPDRQSCQRQGGDGPGAHWRIEMTTASPPRLSISPVRFAFRCRITPDSFCSQRSPPLAVPIAKP